MRFSFSLISRVNDLEPLWKEWRQLADRDSKARLSVCQEWVRCWIETYWEAQFRLHVILVKEADTLVAILPLYFNPDKGAYLVLGTGEPEITEVASEYLDFLVADDRNSTGDLYLFMASNLQQLTPGKTIIYNCVPDSHIFQVARYNSRTNTCLTGKQYQIDLADGYETIFSQFSANTKKSCRQLLNRYQKNSALSFQLVEKQDTAVAWQALVDLHQADWQARGKPGAFVSEEFRRFHGMLAYRGNEEIQRVFSILRHGEEVIAINLYYRYRGVAYFYQSGVVKDRYNRFSPGILLTILTIQAMANKPAEYQVYDFMKGGVNGSYKHRFCQPGDGFFTLTFYGQGIIAGLQYLANMSKAWLKHKRQ